MQAFLREVTQFDLVLVDFSIPTPRYQRSMDGPELICQVKHQLDNPPLLVLISSFFTPGLLKDVESICPEADAILSKELEAAEMFAQMQQLLAAQTPLNKKPYRSHYANSLSRALLILAMPKIEL